LGVAVLTSRAKSLTARLEVMEPEQPWITATVRFAF
jgi:hypothetical protein